MGMRAGGVSQQGARGQAAPAVPMASMGTNVGRKVPVRFPITPSPCRLPPEDQGCRVGTGAGECRGGVGGEADSCPLCQAGGGTSWVWPELGWENLLPGQKFKF